MVINKINDFNCFDENEFLKLETVLNRKKEATYKTKKEAQLHKNLSKNTYVEENVNGYSVKTLDKIAFNEALNSGLFKKVAWGEYLYSSFTGRNDTFPEKYDFDDGSIWKVEKDEDGNEYLVKEVDDEDNLVRVASAKTNNYITPSNFDDLAKVLSVFKSKDEIVEYVKKDKNINKYLFDVVNSRLEDYVKDYFTKNKYAESKEMLNDVMNIVGKMAKDGEIKSASDLDEVIKTICDKTMTTESKYSFF
jgi:hypothetical protein